MQELSGPAHPRHIPLHCFLWRPAMLVTWSPTLCLCFIVEIICLGRALMLARHNGRWKPMRRDPILPLCRATDRGTGNRGAKSSSRVEAPAEAIRLRRLSAEVHRPRRQPRSTRLPDSYASNECPFYSRKCTWFYRISLRWAPLCSLLSEVL